MIRLWCILYAIMTPRTKPFFFTSTSWLPSIELCSSCWGIWVVGRLASTRSGSLEGAARPGVWNRSGTKGRAGWLNMEKWTGIFQSWRMRNTADLQSCRLRCPKIGNLSESVGHICVGYFLLYVCKFCPPLIVYRLSSALASKRTIHTDCYA